MLDTYRYLCYTVCMMKRINMYLGDEDRKMVAYLQEKYNLDTESSTIRFLIRKLAKEEGYQTEKKEQRKE